MRALDELKRNGEGFAQTDALRAILTDPRKRGKRLRPRSRLRELLGRPAPAPPQQPAGYQMDKHCIAEAAVREIVAAAGGRVRDVVLSSSTQPDFNGSLRYLAAAPREGYVSTQSCVSR